MPNIKIFIWFKLNGLTKPEGEGFQEWDVVGHYFFIREIKLNQTNQQTLSLIKGRSQIFEKRVRASEKTIKLVVDTNPEIEP